MLLIDGQHPAAFPEEILTVSILQSSKEWDLVLETFAGSWTTGTQRCDRLVISFVGYDLSNYIC